MAFQCIYGCSYGRSENGDGKDQSEIHGEKVKSGGDRAVNWIWRQCNIVVLCLHIGGLRVPLNKGKGERTECKNYRSISFLSVDGNICGDHSR